jgi:hypothetical protein
MNIFIFSSVLYIIYLNQGPVFLDKLSLISENANEFMFLIICYHMVLFIELLDSPSIHKGAGESLIFCILLHLGANTGLIATVTLKATLRRAKLSKLKAKRTKILSERKEALGILKSASRINSIFNRRHHAESFDRHRAVFEQEMRYVETKAALQLK